MRNRNRLEQLNFQKAMGGQFKVDRRRNVPQPASDRGPVFAALGFVGGGALPIGLLLLPRPGQPALPLLRRDRHRD